MEIPGDLAQADGGVGSDPGLLVAEKPGKMLHDHTIVQVIEVQFWRQMNHGYHSFLPEKFQKTNRVAGMWD